MDRNQRIILLTIMTIGLMVGMTKLFAIAAPTSPGTLTTNPSSSFNVSAYSPRSANALAGNLSSITLTTIQPTQSWSGLFGNISGTITLDDASNFTLYAWTTSEPRGTIYAVNQTITDWSTAHCLNITNNVPNNISQNYSYDGGTQYTNTTKFLTLQEIESVYNITPSAADGVDETFNISNTHDGFFVGNTEILINDCAATNTYQADAAQSSNYQEVLLTVNNSEVVIFTTLIENRASTNDTDPIAFNNQRVDFQMLVLENGRFGDEATTPYYIYVELQ